MTKLETLVYTGTHVIGANVTIGPCPTYLVCKSGLDWTNTTIHFLYFLLLLLLPRVPALFSTTLSHDAFVNLGDLKETFHLLSRPRVVTCLMQKKNGLTFSLSTYLHWVWSFDDHTGIKPREQSLGRLSDSDRRPNDCSLGIWHPCDTYLCDKQKTRIIGSSNLDRGFKGIFGGFSGRFVVLFW